MRVLIVTNVDYFFVSHRLRIGLEALKRGHEVHLALEVIGQRALLEGYGFVVHDVAVGRNSINPLGMMKMFWGLSKIIRKIKPDIIHLVTIKPVLVGGLAAKFFSDAGVVYAISGLGYVFTAGGVVSKLRRYLVQVWYRLILNVPKMTIIFQNPEDRDKIKALGELPDEKMVIIPGSGVDLSEYAYVPLDKEFRETVVVLASRLLIEKGVREFVEAARRIKLKRSNVRFLLIGAPDPANPASILKKELDDWRVEGWVEVLGARSDIAHIMQQSHIVVLPSYYGEGLPKVLIEAAACGRAIVTTNMPGCRDAIEPGVTGLVVAPKNVDELVEAIQKLINEPELCIRMGIMGRRRAESLFNVEDVALRHMDIYRNLVKM